MLAGVACHPFGGGADPRPEVLRLGLHSGPQTLDPHRHDEVVTRWILGHVYESLVGFDAEMALVPQLAMRWESPDDLTWRFSLRPGVRFHDGSPLTADDVVASLERARRLPDDQVSGYLVAVAAVRARDPLTVELVTSRPYPILLNKLASVAIVPAAVGDEPITRPIGSGPYRFQGASSDGGRYDFAANPEHWQGPPEVTRLEIHVVPDGAERVARVLARTLDVVHEVPPSAVPALAASSVVRPLSRAGLSVTYLHLRADGPPFSDLRVRRAVSLAIDREDYVARELGGQGTPLGQLVTANVFGHLRQLAPPRRDLGAARALLAEAGYPGGLDLELEVRQGRPYRALVDQLGEVGIRVHALVRPWQQLYPRLVAGEVAVYLGGWSCLSGDASDLFDAVLHSRQPALGYGDSNFTAYANPELDRLIEASGTTLRMVERAELLTRAMELAVADVALVPIAAPHAVYGVRSDLSWQPRFDGRVNAHEMRWAAGGMAGAAADPAGSSPPRRPSRPAAGSGPR